MSEEGNLYSITNESGTVEMTGISFPTGFKPIGHTVLNNDIIVILCDASNNSQIGYIVEDDSPDSVTGFYHASGPVDASGVPLANNSELGFKQIHPVDCVSRKLINGHRLLYFTDNQVPYGYFDLDNPPIEGSVADSVKLTFDQSIPKINITEIIEGVNSSIRPGVTQFITRYVTANGGTTVFGIPSEVFPMVPTNRSDGASAYSGEFYEDGTITKNLRVQFDNVDLKYQELEIVALYYESSASIFKASIVGQVPITSNSIEFIYTGPDTENLINLTAAELQQVVVSYTHAKCIEQKDNTLYLSNLRDERTKFADSLQEIANKVRVKYRIDNIQFSGRGDDSTTAPTLLFTNSISPFTSGIYNVTLQMNFDIDATSATAATYQLTKNGTSAAASITVVAFGSIVVGNTITITMDAAYTGTQTSPLVFTAVAFGQTPLANEFAIGTDNASTAENIWTTINSSANVTGFYVTYASGASVIDLLWTTVDVNVNNSTVVSSNVAGITSTNFTGANTTIVTVNSSSVSVSANEAVIVFPAAVSAGDELTVVSPGFISTSTTATNSFDTGTSGLPITTQSGSSAATSTTAPGFTDYTNEFLTANKKGYRRGEVYSLGFKILWNDGSMSTAFHIPGYDGYATTTGKSAPIAPDAWPVTNDGTASDAGYLGTYVSEDTYPLDQKYPGNDTGDDTTVVGATGIERNVRHHYIPRLENQPHYKNVGDVEFIRVLGLDFEFGTPIPNNILKEADEIIFLRERRNTENNKSVHAQGVVHKHMITADSFSNDGVVDGSALSGEPSGSAYENMKSSYYVSEIPFFNLNLEVRIDSNFVKNGARMSRGQVTPLRSITHSGATYANGERMKSGCILNQVMFYSPESVLLSGFKLNEERIVGYNLTQELRMNGKIKAINFKGDRQKSDTGAFINNRHKISKWLYADLFCNYSKINTIGIDSANNRTVTAARYLDPHTKRIPSIDPDHPALKTGTHYNQGGLQLLLDGNIFSTNDTGSHQSSIFIRNKFDPEYTNDRDDERSELYYDNGTSYYPNSATRMYPGSTEIGNNRSLYNLTSVNLKQYGQISNGAYISISRTAIKNINGTPITTFSSIFGGDTFITKFSFNTGIICRYDPFYDDGWNPINSAKGGRNQRPYPYDNTGTTSKGGWDLRSSTYYFVESNINTHYRHRPDDELTQNYFPNELDLSTMFHKWYPYLENIKAYNTQYSYENNVIESFTPGSTSEVISEFENRTIYSEQAAPDDTLDAYRSFLVKDLYDLPSEKGPIWDTFVEYNTLFMHTPKTLWKTFAESQATIKGGNIADAVLGTSRLFARPAQEVLETEGGYGGSISQFGGAHTQLGYIFVDVLQGKIFLLGVTKTGGTVLNELSKAGISTEMHKGLSLGITKFNGQVDLTNVATLKGHLIDNPYMGIGIVSGYDYKLNRYLITKFPAFYTDESIQPPVTTKQSDGFTLSYSKDVGKWFNYHSYKPNIYIAYNNRLLFVNNKNTTSELHEMNIGAKGSYFGTVYNSELTYVIAAKGQTCIFNNIVINSVSTDKTTEIKQRDDNFKEMTVYNQKANTGPYEMVPNNTFGITLTAGQVSIKHRNDEYRIAIPRDSVVNNSLNIFDSTNLDNTVKFREKIKGNYAIVNLKYDNTADLQFVINFIKNIFTNNFR
jgi:hypothetical protein